MPRTPPPLNLTRRTVVAAGSTSAVVLAVGPGRAQPTNDPGAPRPSSETVSFRVNGEVEALRVDPRVTLLDAVREHLALTGTKKGCDHGQCGACTVLVNGRRINSCLSLAVMHDGDEVTTIEGLGTPDRLSPLQAAFVTHDAYQCGYCTPGQICAAVGMLGELKSGVPSYVTTDLTGPAEPSEAEIRERMSGNICRCAAYPNIVAAIREVAGESQ